MCAAGRAYGVICADRGGGRFELSDGERHLLWTLGKTAALVATARNATRQQERARRLGERLELAREIHERVLQRLFGVSLALSAETAAGPARSASAAGSRCRRRSATCAPRWSARWPRAARDRDDAGGGARAAARDAGGAARAQWPEELTVPPDLEPLAQSVLAETLRNVAKHARAHPGAGRRRRATRTRSRSRSATTARAAARAAPAWACAWPPSRPSSTAAWSSSVPRASTDWRVRLVVPLAQETA